MLDICIDIEYMLGTKCFEIIRRLTRKVSSSGSEPHGRDPKEDRRRVLKNDPQLDLQIKVVALLTLVFLSV